MPLTTLEELTLDLRDSLTRHQVYHDTLAADAQISPSSSAIVIHQRNWDGWYPVQEVMHDYWGPEQSLVWPKVPYRETADLKEALVHEEDFWDILFRLPESITDRCTGFTAKLDTDLAIYNVRDHPPYVTYTALVGPLLHHPRWQHYLKPGLWDGTD